MPTAACRILGRSATRAMSSFPNSSIIHRPRTFPQRPTSAQCRIWVPCPRPEASTWTWKHGKTTRSLGPTRASPNAFSRKQPRLQENTKRSAVLAEEDVRSFRPTALMKRRTDISINEHSHTPSRIGRLGPRSPRRPHLRDLRLRAQQPSHGTPGHL